MLVFGAANKFKKKGTIFLGRKLDEQKSKIDHKGKQKEANARLAGESLGNIAKGTGQRDGAAGKDKGKSKSPTAEARTFSRTSSKRPALSKTGIMGAVVSSPPSDLRGPLGRRWYLKK